MTGAATVTSYQVGHLLGLLFLAIVAIAVILHLLGGNRLTDTRPSPPKPPPAWAPYPPPQATYQPPPQIPAPMASLAAPEALSLPAAVGQRSPIVRRSYLIALGVVGGLLLLGVISASVFIADYRDLPPGFQSQAGAQIHHDFEAGCTGVGAPAAYCACMFSQLTAQPQWNTIASFLELNREVNAAVAAGSNSGLSPAYLATVRACRTVATA